jgi:serine/threonine protein kinase
LTLASQLILKRGNVSCAKHARLRHPKIASVFYYGTRKSDGQCFYAMDLIEGETLEARIRRAGPLATALALEVIAQVARALVAAEAHGLVHRGLKPVSENPSYNIRKSVRRTLRQPQPEVKSIKSELVCRTQPSPFLSLIIRRSTNFSGAHRE